MIQQIELMEFALNYVHSVNTVQHGVTVATTVATSIIRVINACCNDSRKCGSDSGSDWLLQRTICILYLIMFVNVRIILNFSSDVSSSNRPRPVNLIR